MSDLFNELLQLLEKTTVLVEFDHTKIGYMNYGQSEADQGVVPNEEDMYYYYTIKVDGYSNLINYSKRVDFLIQEFNKELESRISDKVYYKDVKNQLEKIKSVVLSIYSNLQISSFSDQTNIRERGVGNKTSYYFKPNIYINYVNGTELDSDFGEFRIIEKFVEKKFYFAKRLIGLVESSFEKLKEEGANIKLGTLKFRDERLLNSSRLDDFRIKLFDSKQIDKLDARLFSKCFSGKEVDEKINWRSDNLSFVYFIRQLNRYLISSKRINWIEVSNSFLFNSQIIIPKKIRTTSALCSKDKRAIIDDIISQLELKSSVSIPKIRY